MSTVFNNGIPTDVDVANLFKQFGTPSEGALLAYDAIADVIKAPYGSNRFRTVVARWKRLMEGQPHNVYLRARPDQRAYLVMDPSLRVAKMGQHDRSARRHTRRGFILGGTTDTARLSPEEKQQHTHLHHKFASALQADRSLSRRPVPQIADSNV